MAWVAFDRAAIAVEAEGLKDHARRWRQIADEIHAEVCKRGFDRDLNSFVQAYGSKQLDASLLQLPLVGFLPAADPRWRAGRLDTAVRSEDDGVCARRSAQLDRTLVS